MAKQSAFLAKLQAKKAAELAYQRQFTIQWCADAAVLAAHEVFQRTGPKLVEFNNAFVRWAHDIAEMTLEDAKDDREIVYTKEKVDRQLKKILGDDFIPFEERYGQGHY